MSTALSAPSKTAALKAQLSRYLVPYYLTLAAVIGAITALFAVLTLVIVLVVTNFNVLGLIE
jgi:hypothetical protein